MSCQLWKVLMGLVLQTISGCILKNCPGMGQPSPMERQSGAFLICQWYEIRWFIQNNFNGEMGGGTDYCQARIFMELADKNSSGKNDF
jgi:hypothetical protein